MQQVYAMNECADIATRRPRMALPARFAFIGAFLVSTVGAAAAENLVDELRKATATVVLVDEGAVDASRASVNIVWQGDVCRPVVVNSSDAPIRVARVDLFDGKHRLPGDTPIYGESFQMLAQTVGTLASPKDLGTYPDRTHYRLEEPEGLRTAHGMLLLSPQQREPLLIGFTSCRRFDGRISFDASRLLVSVDCEGIQLAPGEQAVLEEFYCDSAPSREKLLDRLAEKIEVNHPRRRGFDRPPMGWCSWYSYGPSVTVPDVRRNLDWIVANAPELRYIQIDDGYQPWMGDWLETGKSFGGDVKGVLHKVRARGFEPAIWLAPFVASPESQLFRDHPDWFVKNDSGEPLRSDQVGFGGWRLGPWYVLDGTHPEAQAFLEQTIRTMRVEWGCSYFKLDALYWGAIRQGRFYDAKATKIEAYRRGMAAILRGAGDAYVLGCNHPIWASFGLLDGSRSSNDIQRHWTSIQECGRETLARGWQNGRLWWNDPDCALLGPELTRGADGNPRAARELPPNEVLFHAAVLHASGGALLSGDDLTLLTPASLALLNKLIPPTGRAAQFADGDFIEGRTPTPTGELIYLFNWGDEVMTRRLELPRQGTLRDYWTGETVGELVDELGNVSLPPRSARVLEISQE